MGVAAWPPGVPAEEPACPRTPLAGQQILWGDESGGVSSAYSCLQCWPALRELSQWLSVKVLIAEPGDWPGGWLCKSQEKRLPGLLSPPCMRALISLCACGFLLCPQMLGSLHLGLTPLQGSRHWLLLINEITSPVHLSVLSEGSDRGYFLLNPMPNGPVITAGCYP